MKNFVILLLIMGFNKTFCQDSLKYTKLGFLIYNELPYIDFIPVKNMDLENPLNSLCSSNFLLGVQFNGYPDPTKELKYKRILSPNTLDSFMYVTRIIPVELNYCISFVKKEKEYKRIYTNLHILYINNKVRKLKVKIDFSKEIKPLLIKYL